jgi:hypothetical protein
MPFLNTAAGVAAAAAFFLVAAGPPCHCLIFVSRIYKKDIRQV